MRRAALSLLLVWALTLASVMPALSVVGMISEAAALPANHSPSMRISHTIAGDPVAAAAAPPVAYHVSTSNSWGDPSVFHGRSSPVAFHVRDADGNNVTTPEHFTILPAGTNPPPVFNSAERYLMGAPFPEPPFPSIYSVEFYVHLSHGEQLWSSQYWRQVSVDQPLHITAPRPGSTPAGTAAFEGAEQSTYQGQMISGVWHWDEFPTVSATADQADGWERVPGLTGWTVRDDGTIRVLHERYSLGRGAYFTWTLGEEPTVPDLTLRKTLTLGEGVDLPTPPPSFEFDFEPTQAQVQLSPPIQSRPVADLAGLVDPNPQVVQVDPATGSGTPRTYTGDLDLWELFDDMDFPGGGVFAWNISELVGSSNTTTPYVMSYDPARFQVWVWVESDGSLYDIRIFPINEADNGDDDEYTLGAKIPYINFGNTLNRPPVDQDLEISKTVTLNHDRPYLVALDLTYFRFNLVLTGDDLPSPITATIVNTATGTPVAGTRNPVTITGGTAEFDLKDGETLRVPALPVGTTFNVTEVGRAEFVPSLEVFILGDSVHTASAGEGQNLSSGTHTLISGTGRNAVDFENEHQDIPFSGLNIVNNIPVLVIVVPILALAAYLVWRNRKAKEELPL